MGFKFNIGDKVGYWTVVDRKSIKYQKVSRGVRYECNRTLYECRCICGTVSVLTLHRLNKGVSKSCGCQNQADFATGQKIGKLTILGKSNKTTKWGIYWNCKCDCGKECLKIASQLNYAIKHNQITSCGCWLLRKIEYGLSSKKNLFGTYKRQARERKLAFELSFAKFIELTSSNCKYCGTPPKSIVRSHTKHNNGEYIYNGIDRVDNIIGYIDTNCVPCCITCNSAKGQMTLDEFRDYALRLWSNINKLPTPEVIYYALGEYRNMKISEIAKTEAGRAWLLNQYLVLGDCPIRHAIGKILIQENVSLEILTN